MNLDDLNHSSQTITTTPGSKSSSGRLAGAEAPLFDRLPLRVWLATPGIPLKATIFHGHLVTDKDAIKDPK